MREKEESQNYILIVPQYKYSQDLIILSLVQHAHLTSLPCPLFFIDKVSLNKSFTLNSQRNFNLNLTQSYSPFAIISVSNEHH